MSVESFQLLGMGRDKEQSSQSMDFTLRLLRLTTEFLERATRYKSRQKVENPILVFIGRTESTLVTSSTVKIGMRVQLKNDYSADGVFEVSERDIIGILTINNDEFET